LKSGALHGHSRICILSNPKIKYFIDLQWQPQQDIILLWLQEQQGAPIQDVRVVGEDQSSLDIMSDVELDIPFDCRGGHVWDIWVTKHARTPNDIRKSKQEHAKTDSVLASPKKSNGAAITTSPSNGGSSKLPTAAFFLAEQSMIGPCGQTHGN
jgi:hypothetical protein